MTEPLPLYSGAQVRQMDRYAIASLGLQGYELMERAGLAAFGVLTDTWPSARRLQVVCGTGNNGGDGWVVARLALEAGWTVAVELLGDVERIQSDAETALRAFVTAGGTCHSRQPADQPPDFDADVLVDALCGTGGVGDLRPEHIAWVQAINDSGIPVVAIDAPTGLNVDTGNPRPVAVRAFATITFIAPKKGLFTGSAGDFVGALRIDNLGLPEQVLASAQPEAYLSDWSQLRRQLPARNVAHHKGLSGHVLVIGGNTGYSGAAILAARAALRSGAGLVSLATQPQTACVAVACQAEIMAHPIDNVADLKALLSAASCVVIGPGLGRDRWAQMCMSAVLERSPATVFDADALNLLALDDPASLKGGNHILTPHPGEAARLLGVATQRITEDRFIALRELTDRWRGACVLKGSGTLTGQPGLPARLCAYGNPGMASGGMGDVLAGILGGLLAQGLDVFTAAELGVSAHAVAGDVAARQGARGLLPSDVIDALRGVLAGLDGPQ